MFNKDDKFSKFAVIAKLLIAVVLLIATFVIVWCAKVFSETRFEIKAPTVTVVTMPEEKSLESKQKEQVVQEIFAEDFQIPVLSFAPEVVDEEPNNEAMIKEEPEEIAQNQEVLPLDDNGDSAPKTLLNDEKSEDLEKKDEPQVLKTEDNQEEKYAYISIVIDDAGASAKRTQEIIDIKAPLTLAFLPQGKDLKDLLNKAVSAGHEIMVHVPMQPRVPASLEPDTLMVKMSDDQIKETLLKMLSAFDGFEIKGINNHMGSFLTESAPKMDIVMSVLNKKGLFFLDSKTTPNSKAEPVAEIEAVPYIARDVFIDNENNYNAIIKQLQKAEKIALKRGYVVAIGHPKSQTSKALADWVKTLEPKGIKMVYLSTLVEQKSKKN